MSSRHTKVRNSIVQTTQVVEHDHALDYFDPRLSIVTHKTSSYLQDQLKQGRKMENFEQYLRKSNKTPLLPERAAELKRMRIAKEVARGPPYNCARNEGKRMGIQVSMKKYEEVRLSEARSGLSPVKAQVKFDSNNSAAVAANTKSTGTSAGAKHYDIDKLRQSLVATRKFHVVGCQNPNTTRAQRKKSYQTNCILSVMSDTVRRANTPSPCKKQQRPKIAMVAASEQRRLNKQNLEDLIVQMPLRD